MTSLPQLIYLIPALAALAGSTLALIAIGRRLAACPSTGPGARAASLAAATSFAMTGLGGVMLLAPTVALVGPLLPLALAMAGLGLGFGRVAARLGAAMALIAKG